MSVVTAEETTRDYPVVLCVTRDGLVVVGHYKSRDGFQNFYHAVVVADCHSTTDVVCRAQDLASSENLKDTGAVVLGFPNENVRCLILCDTKEWRERLGSPPAKE